MLKDSGDGDKGGESFQQEAHITDHTFKKVPAPYKYPYKSIGMITGKIESTK